MGRDHPLTGRIWDVAAGAFIAEDRLLDRLASVRFVVAGESHNNPDHHLLQLRILESIVKTGRRVSVGLEFFTTEDQAALDGYNGSATSDPEALRSDLGLGKKRGALWDAYLPLISFAGAAGLPLVAMDMSREEVASIKQRGLDAIPDGAISRFGLDRPLPGPLQDILVRDLYDAHCGLMLPRSLDASLLAQRMRDVTMAQRIESAAEGGGTLLLSGYGHARNDRGVPFLLNELRQEGALVSILLASVKEALVEPEQYATWFGGQRLPFDYVWFTPRVDDEDPCERLRRIYRIPATTQDAGPATGWRSDSSALQIATEQG